MIEFSAPEARRLRGRAQLIGGSALDPVSVVTRGVAFQGQDAAAALRAIALRSASGTSLDDVRAAFDRGELVRAWTMRGTLFATTPSMLAALSPLTSARTHAMSLRIREGLGLDAVTIDRAREVALAALDGGSVTRAELMTAWQHAGLDVSRSRGSHLVYHLSVEGLFHWGAFRGKAQVLTRTPPHPVADPHDVLTRVAAGYLRSHGPASLEDFAGWLTLPKGVVREAFHGVGEEVGVEGRPMRMLDDGVGAGDLPSVALLPGFDEWVLGYRDRSLVASSRAWVTMTPGGNGVFRPTIVVDGVVVGTWRNGEVVDLVERVTAKQRKAIDAALAAWAYG